ncbi:MAG: hypothetical protein ACXWRE_13405 [Pseudobdellovibrionaceae bacterium]
MLSILLSFAVSSFAIAASPSASRDECLKTMLREEFTGREKGRYSSISTVIERTTSKMYYWTAKDEAVAMRTGVRGKIREEIAWDPRTFLKDGDGRVAVKSLKGEKIFFEDLKKIQNWYLVNSEVSKWLSKPKILFPNQAIIYDRVYLACAGVDEVKLPTGLPLGKAAAQGRAKLHKAYPQLFKSSGHDL